MSKLEDIIGNGISKFNQTVKLPSNLVNVEQQLKSIVAQTAQEIRDEIINAVNECNTDALQTDMIDYSNLVEKIQTL